MKKNFSSIRFALLAGSALMVASCGDKKNEPVPTTAESYVLALGVTANNTTAYYVVTAKDLMSGTISAAGSGIEHNGYHDYEQGGQTIFSVGGLGVTNVTGIVRDGNGNLTERGEFSFTKTLGLFSQIDETTMMGVELPEVGAGDQILFYSVGINSVAITERKTAPIAPLAYLDNPTLTGLAHSGGNIYITYFPLNPQTYATAFTDTTYVAVYDYPAMTLKKIMKDTRTGAAGSWNAYNGIFKVESGDLYIMSNSAIANGFSQSTKNAAFLRIPAGATDFDNYYFDFETATGGLKPAHIKYIGNGLLLAEVSTLNPQTADDRWGDKSLKTCIIDLNAKTVRDVAEIPVHDGDGGRRFAALVDEGYVYLPVNDGAGNIYIYRISPQTATAERGAKVATSFVAGVFRLQ